MLAPLVLPLVLASCGGVRMPASVTSSNQALVWRVQPVAISSPCSPKPCALVGGLEIMISNIDRNATPPPNDPPRPAGSHYLRLDVSFLAVTGTHTVYDPRAATPIVIDEDGPDTSTNSAPGAAITYDMANPVTSVAPLPPHRRPLAARWAAMSDPPWPPSVPASASVRFICASGFGGRSISG
jgi:hypothetical protein